MERRLGWVCFACHWRQWTMLPSLQVCSILVHISNNLVLVNINGSKVIVNEKAYNLLLMIVCWNFIQQLETASLIGVCTQFQNIHKDSLWDHHLLLCVLILVSCLKISAAHWNVEFLLLLPLWSYVLCLVGVQRL